MLKQLSTVFLIIFGFIFLKEDLVLTKIIGALIIIFGNLILAFDKGKFKINKYFIMSIISNILFAIAMLINVNISDYFNLAIYTIITVSIPALLIFIFERPEMQKYNQSILAEYFNIKIKNAHRAEDDAYVCGQIFLNCIKVSAERQKIRID